MKQNSISSCSKLDRLVSGNKQVTQAFSYLSPRKLREFGFPLNQIFHPTLATYLYSLARYSKRTIQLLRAVSFYSHQVSESFHSLLQVLFNFPSQYLYTISLKMYLRLEVSNSQIHTQYPMDTTQDTYTFY